VVNLGSKRKGLVHDIQSSSHIGDGLPDPERCLDQTLVGDLVVMGDLNNHDIRQIDQVPSRTAKRLKVDHSPTSMADCETHSLPTNSSSVSTAVPCIPQGNSDGEARGIPISSSKGPTKHAKGKRPVRRSRPKTVGPETHPLQGGGILDVCCHPSFNHDHFDIPDGVHHVIMESEGRQQAQDIQLTNEDWELVTTKGRQLDLDSKPVLDSEGPREISFCADNVSMEDAERLNAGICSDTLLT